MQGWPAVAQELISALPVDRWFRSMKKPELRGAGGNSGFCFGFLWIAPVAPEASSFKLLKH
jgi:hypothetical protein